ncbi:DUF4173 domain-containing protein [Candidatus Parcubacteria bacterium]|nr:MAG: DUF4173 domain-containing protein [Candidatus Parcubacteria bacterium]
MDMQNPQPELKQGHFLIAGASLILGLLFNFFFFEKMPGLSFPLYVIFIISLLYVISALLKKKISSQVAWLAVPLVFFSAMVFVRSSELLTFLNAAASLALLLLVAGVAFENEIKKFLLSDYIKIPFLPLKFIFPLLKTLSGLFLAFEKSKDKKILPQVIKGVLMAIPVLFVFLMLFSSADLIFQKYVSDFINFDEETYARIIIVFLVTLAFMGAYSYIFKERGEEKSAGQKNQYLKLGHIENSILLGSVNILFFIFMIVQFTYLFGGQSNISAQGLTYAEYARRGFFELIFVAIISLTLLLLTEKFVVKKETDHLLIFKILSAALVLQVILIMASAFIRLSLYEQAYGFTVLRLFSHAFIFLLSLIFCLLLYKIYKDNRENAFAFRVFVSLIIFLAFMNLFNPDVFIARQNIKRFNETGKLDVHYLSRLSDDAIEDTIKILDISDENLKKNFARDLYWRVERNNSVYFSGWQTLNLSRLKAGKILNSKISELEPYKDYQNPETL